MEKRRDILSIVRDHCWDPEIRQIFLCEGCEPLTDVLIGELVARGWPKDDLNFARGARGVFCRQRNSILFPPEVETLQGGI